MPNGRSASVLVPLSSLIRPQRISWRAASRHIHELRRHRETLRPAGQHSRRGVAPVCSLERVRPLERDTGPSEGLRLRFGKEKTLAARDNSVGILGAGGHRGRIPPSAGPEGSHERVPSAQICCELRTGRLFRESNGRASFPRPFLLRPRPFGNNPCRPRLQARWELALGLRHAEKLALPLLGCLRVMPEEVPSGEK